MFPAGVTFDGEAFGTQRAAEERSESVHARSICAPFGMLWECVSCTEHASEACSMVERERRAYDRGD